MIVVRMKGGLGNQMFQYACGLSLARRLDKELALSLDWFDLQQLRVFNLEQWQIPAARTCRAPDPRFLIPDTNKNPPAAKRRLRQRLYNRLVRWRYRNWMLIAEERSGHFQPIAQQGNPRKTLLLEGYWQSERYFEGVEARLRQVFAPRRPFADDDRRLANDMRGNTTSVSVHIRCGDYTTDPATRLVHYVCTPDYYREALRLMQARLGDARPHFHVFSDDPMWVGENIELPVSHSFASDGRRGEAHEISLMAHCRHHIIANSSFSWWGAWLNPDRDKIVIAPRRWFSTRASPDIIPADWIKCPVSGSES